MPESGSGCLDIVSSLALVPSGNIYDDAQCMWCVASAQNQILEVAKISLGHIFAILWNSAACPLTLSK